MNTLFKALNDQTRRGILELLKQKDMTAGEIAEQFNISKPSISHHLDILKQAELVIADKQGQFIFYSLNTTVVGEVLKWIIQLQKTEETSKHNIHGVKNFLKHLPVLLISILPLGYLMAIWDSLPENIAVHYNIKGEVDRYGSNMELLFITILLFVTSFGVYLLLVNIHKIDPKMTKALPVNTYSKIGGGIMLFTTIINLVIIINGANPESTLANKVMVPSIGLLFMFLGNNMYNIKPNHFVGIRVPWTLESDYNWKKTHQLAAKLFFIGGLGISIISIISSFMIAMITISLLASIISVVYSYSIFKQESISSK